MASYETEHATDPSGVTDSRRPDLSSFFTLLSEIAPSDSQERTREHAVPVPGDVSAAYRSLADAFQIMLRDNDNADDGLLQNMIESLMSTADQPPTEVKGVSEEYIADLERVDVKKVKKDADCPICGEGFRDDKYPLLVRLPCHVTHVFDLECVRPWLLLNGTCPLDRVDLGKRERERKQKRLEEIKRGAKEEDEEEEWDGLYG